MNAQLHGDLAQILAFTATPNEQHPSAGEGCRLSVVAGARNISSLILDIETDVHVVELITKRRRRSSNGLKAA
jgi:hypothetical protein